MTTPPRARRNGPIVRLIGRCLPPTAAGRSILGDLLEEYHARPAGVRREAWFAAVAVQVAMRYLPDRVRRARAPGARAAVLLDDIRSGWRGLRRDRATVALAVLTLAVGIGSVTAILSAMYGSLLKPLPFRDPDAILVLGDRSAGMPTDRIAGNIALVNVHDLRDASRALQSVAAYRDAEVTVSGAGDARRVRAQQIDAAFFDVLGTSMRAGRGFQAGDQRLGAEPVVVIAEALGRQLFLEEAMPVGRQLRIDGVWHRVVGIAPPVTQLGNPQLWLPLVPDERLSRRISRQVYAVARLADGVPAGAARSDLTAIFERVRAAHPEIGSDRSVGAMAIRDWILGERGPRLLTLLAGAVVLVLVIAATNVSNLLLARTERRQSDLAVRAALGASRFRLVRELAAEALLIALAASAAGLLVAMWCVRLLVRLYGTVLPRSWEIGLYPPVLAGALFLAGGVGLAVSVLPSLRLPRTRLRDRIGDHRRSSSRHGWAQRALIAGETAVAMLLLGVSGLLINSVWRLSSHDPGVRTEGVLVFDISLAGRAQAADALPAFVETYLARLRQLPGVIDVAAATRRPLFGGGNTAFELPGLAPDVNRGSLLEIRDITPAYFRTLSIRAASGRTFSEADRHVPGAMIVNRAFERAFFPDAGALGRLVRPGAQDRTFEVVGVVDDIREFGPAADARPTGYWPYGAGPYGPFSSLTFLIRTTGTDPLTIVPEARARLRELDPGIALDDPVTLAELARSRIGRDRLAIRALLTVAGAVALLLTIVGLYGVLAYAVSARTREIGIRRALGATRAGVVRLLMREGLGMAGPGVAAGLLATLAAGELVSSYLYGITPTDGATLAAAAGLLLLASAAACWIPARRAGRVEAVEALRAE
ncbi:MAG TPA: ADOP family duplicated permease [Vicinamibacterales bacterium]|nr:ADOP family duplicated permease [Vicinamibacterales bacterium]